MATITWNGGTADWNDQSDWTPEQVPTSGDSAALTGDIAADVLINGSETVTVAGLTVDNPLALLEVDGYLSASSILLQAGTIDDDGTIASSTIAMDGGTLSFGYGLLQDDTVQGNLDVDGEAVVQGGLTATGTAGTGAGTITIDGADSTLFFNDTETFDNATITMGSATGLDNLDANGVLTLGTGIVVQSTTASFLDDSLGGNGTIINDGSIVADAPSGEMDLESGNFINNGAILATGGVTMDIQPQGSFANAGTLTVGNASTIAIQDLTAFTNTGSIEINNGGELDLDTYPSALTEAQATGGFVEVDGLLNAEGETLNIGTDSAFSTLLNYGTIENATLLLNGGSLGIGYGLFEGDTVEGNFDVTGSSTAEIQGGLTATGTAGTGAGTITIDGADSTLLFNDTETFDNATITMGSATGLDNLDANGVLTLGTGIVVQSTTASFLDDSLGGNGTIINDGSIVADAPSGEMDLESGNFINNGAILATGGVTMDIQPQGSFANAGTLTVGNASTIAIQGLTAFTNTGSIEINNGGELDLDTYPSALTEAQATGGFVEVDGLLNAEGETLNIGTDSAFSTLLNYGTIENATLLLNGGSLGIGYGLFEGDTVEGNFDVTGSSTAEIQGGLTATGTAGTGAGTITIDGADSTLLFNDTETFDNATITMGSATGLDNLDANGVLTLGTGIVVQSTTASFLDDSLGGNGTIINDGSIVADAPSGEMDLESGSFINNGAILATGGVTMDIQPQGSFANAGTLTVGNASTIAIQGLTAFTNTGSIEINNGGELDLDTYPSALTEAQATGGFVEVDGLLNAEGETLNIGTDSAFSTLLNYGTIENATLLLNGGSLGIGYGLFEGDTVEGNFDVTGSSTAEIQGGLTATGTAGTGAGTITIDGADSTLLFNDTETFDNATITMGSATGLDNLDAGGVLTLGTGIVVQSTTASFLDDSLGGNGTIINDGSIVADAPDGEMDLESGSFINNGAILATGGVTMDIQPQGSFANAGTLTVGNASTIAIQDLTAFTNTGSIEINNGGELDLDTYPSALTETQATGGFVEVDGLLNAEGETLNIGTDSAFSTLLNYGTIENATLLLNGGSLGIGYGLFEGDTVEGNFDVTGSSTAEIQGGLTATGTAGTGAGTITIDGADSTLLFNDTETFDNATITMGSTTGLDNLDANGVLTLGTGIVVQSTTAAFLDDSLGGNGTIINDGSIVADAPDGEMDLESGNFINNGAILATGGVTMDIQPQGSFANAGTLTVGNASTIAIQDLTAFTNTGSIEINNGGELDLDTYPSALTEAQATGGFVEVDGLLNAEGETLNIGTDFAFSTLLNYGTIENATLLLNGGSLGIGYGLFEGDTVEGNFDVTGSSTAEIQGGLTATGTAGTGAGTITIDGADSTLLFNDTETFDNATITMGSATGLDNLDANGVLTLGTGIVVQSTTASFLDDSLGGNGTIINDGSIVADAPDGEMDLESGSFINNGAILATGGITMDIQPQGSFANAGTLTVGNASTIAIQDLTAFTNTGSIEINNGGELDLDTYPSALTETQATGGFVEVDGLLNAEGETLNIGTDSAFSTLLNYGTIENATLLLNGGSLGIGYGLFEGDTVEGNFDVTGESTAEIQGGLTATGTAGTGAGTITIDGADSTLLFNDTETFDNATITMGSATGLDNLDANGVLTLGTGIVVQSTTASFLDDSLGGNGTIINDGSIVADAPDGEMDLESGNFINNGAILATGGVTMDIQPQGSFANAGTLTVSQGATANIAYIGSFTNTGLIDVNAGQLLVDTALQDGGTAGTITLENSGTATFDLGVTADQVINFGTGSNSLIANDPSDFNATLTNFFVGDSITLAGFAQDTHSYADGVLTFSNDGTVTGTLNFAGDYQASDFTYTTDEAGDLIVGTDVLPCFATGTRILTERGEIAVEALREGDQVITVTAGERNLSPVTWIGHRAISVGRHPMPEKVRPVRVAAHAFGPGMPARDLLLSPDHAVYAEGVLVPVKYLINDTTVRFDVTIDRVTYFHVELAAHEVLLAEGLPAESYLETGGRAMFENGGQPVVLHADFSPMSWDALGCAELKVTGAEVDAIRATLAARAESLGDRKTTAA